MIFGVRIRILLERRLPSIWRLSIVYLTASWAQLGH